ncbi:hypothetical protein M427DRAFT_38667 [Gonapodya prolifera JEL478]|uniref:Glycosyltransferase family 25 protein n=1 Tax=Gonapodya prolifera (strain JEL478) TaxID=1344416 RepID=A0A138ZYQ8_GONPJ|nr:hypothetical protein M427DRAFT_38667 [Gonapodya prolifera JEL478]|eukprot:KXS09611.1 hypothetical protein M427DRAFT_38667 [Gonapodya prolifera JEL478]
MIAEASPSNPAWKAVLAANAGSRVNRFSIIGAILLAIFLLGTPWTISTQRIGDPRSWRDSSYAHQPPRPTGLFPKANATATELLIESQYLAMCRGETVFPEAACVRTKMAEAAQPIQVGLEIWLPSVLRDLYTDGNGAHPENVGSLPAIDRYPYDVAEPVDSRRLPFVYAAANPSNASLMQRFRKRLELNDFRYEWVDFGWREDVIRRQDWIRKYVSTQEIPTGKDTFTPHDLASITPFDVFEKLVNHPTMKHSMYLETDAVPVHGLQRKLASIMRQLEAVAPDWDVVFLGTCHGLEHKEVRQEMMVSPNLASVPRARCFNAVLISKECARKVLEYGARDDLPFSVDDKFDELIKRIPLRSLWAQHPLFYEESKQEARNMFLCEGDWVPAVPARAARKRSGKWCP